MKRTIFSLLFLVLWNSNLPAQTPFYEGKRITLIAGTTAGSVYDQYARFLAQNFGKYILGNPTFVVQNIAGAGSLIAANHLYTLVKPDGLTVASIIPAIYFNQLTARKEVRFDYSKFNWIGSVERSDNLIYMRSDTPFKTIYDVRRATQPPKCTATAIMVQPTPSVPVFAAACMRVRTRPRPATPYAWTGWCRPLTDTSPSGVNVK